MDHEADQRVVAELRRKGFDVSSVWDLVHTTDDYTDAVPLLVRMLSRTADYDVKEGIVRALSPKTFRAAAFQPFVATLEDLFDDMTSRADTLKWAIGNALSVQATKDDGETLTNLLDRAEAGGARQMIALAIGRIKHRASIPVLIRLLQDPRVAAQAASALGKMNAHEARDALLQLAYNSKGLAKKEAEKALARIGRDKSELPA
jgi:HEAT repeat protein